MSCRGGANGPVSGLPCPNPLTQSPHDFMAASQRQRPRPKPGRPSYSLSHIGTSVESEDEQASNKARKRSYMENNDVEGTWYMT